MSERGSPRAVAARFWRGSAPTRASRSRCFTRRVHTYTHMDTRTWAHITSCTCIAKCRVVLSMRGIVYAWYCLASYGSVHHRRTTHRIRPRQCSTPSAAPQRLKTERTRQESSRSMQLAEGLRTQPQTRTAPPQRCVAPPKRCVAPASAATADTTPEAPPSTHSVGRAFVRGACECDDY